MFEITNEKKVKELFETFDQKNAAIDSQTTLGFPQRAELKFSNFIDFIHLFRKMLDV